MTNGLSFYLPDADEEAPIVRADDIGDGTWLLTETIEDDEAESVCLTFAQLSYVYARACERYGLQARLGVPMAA